MIKLAVPNIGKEEFDEIKKVLDSKYLVQGEKVLEFERMVSRYLNVNNAIAVSSGTAALHLALIALNIKSGHEVIVPDFSFPATSNVVELVGGYSKFVDIKLDSFCIDAEKIEEKITEKTKAIIPVHEFGQSAHMDKIMELAKKYNLKVIEDAACALGAEYKGKKVGSIGNLGCFSFHPRKAITTGEGGMIVTNNNELAEKIRSLRNHGISYKDGKVQFAFAGFNYRMTDIQGAIGVVQMRKLERLIKRRVELANEYNKLLRDAEDILLPVEKVESRHVYQTYHIMVNERINRNHLIIKLKENGIETNLGAYAIHNQKYYKEKYQCDDIEFRNSNLAYNQGLALPLYYGLDDENIRIIVKQILQLMEAVKFE
ncbi:DegT/DnrJ/EryC1/StrS family aminotransferase [Oceanirhabdus sp. W0125-5]|uniref:DegT/DnrJ/EryC1/StrS family aminotransferase n=1 Tax=Oceanirhabdus sp. W0125-5 TaxID=2999116 RepID=UPI0022F2CCF1|nr:DegT/DnrJ/EryC1/StrS family aminotransferase [Oceanirhabdus sp. W0125-5]WBW96608.1 DegT/DnrJ/EryC1/StrS family aminotransferase [Oceanirhabdus sp. W0125-5]